MRVKINISVRVLLKIIIKSKDKFHFKETIRKYFPIRFLRLCCKLIKKNLNKSSINSKILQILHSKYLFLLLSYILSLRQMIHKLFHHNFFDDVACSSLKISRKVSSKISTIQTYIKLPSENIKTMIFKNGGAQKNWSKVDAVWKVVTLKTSSAHANCPIWIEYWESWHRFVSESERKWTLSKQGHEKLRHRLTVHHYVAFSNQTSDFAILKLKGFHSCLLWSVIIRDFYNDFQHLVLIHNI